MSCKGGGNGGLGNGGLTEFAMGMLDTSTGLLARLPEKPTLSRVGSEVDGVGGMGARRQMSFSEGVFGGGGFGIGGVREDGQGQGTQFMAGVGMRSGLVSPTTSVSSSGGESQAGYEAYMLPTSAVTSGYANGRQEDY